MLYREEMTPDLQRRVTNLICVFAGALHEHVGHPGAIRKFEHLLSRQDKQDLERFQNRPLFIANKMSRQLKSIPDQAAGDQLLFSSRERLAMLSHVEKMSQAIGACERLVQTPVPPLLTPLGCPNRRKKQKEQKLL